MEYITPVNNYVVLMPSGELVGFVEVDKARGYIYNYYYNEMLDEVEPYGDGLFDVYTQINDVGIINGVEDGECQIYKLDSFIENIQQSGLLQEEKDDIIAKLLKSEINLNIYEYEIYDILSEADVEWN